MASTGLLQVHAYTSRALVPVVGATVSVTDCNGKLLGVRQTDSSGLITPITIEVPDRAESQSPDFKGQPFTSVTLTVHHPNYAGIQITNVQIFAGVVTVQNLEMIPLSTLPDQFNQTEYFNIPPQNL